MNWLQATIIFGPMIIAVIFFWDDIKWLMKAGLKIFQQH